MGEETESDMREETESGVGKDVAAAVLGASEGSFVRGKPESKTERDDGAVLRARFFRFETGTRCTLPL